MTDQDWNELLPYLRKAARAIFRGVGTDGDWEDAVQEACIAIWTTPNVLNLQAFGQFILKRRYIWAKRSYANRKRANGEFPEIPIRAGFDAGLLVGDWIEKARKRIPPTYRAVVEIDLMSRAHSEGKSSNAVRQRCFKAHRMMREQLAKLGTAA